MPRNIRIYNKQNIRRLYEISEKSWQPTGVRTGARGRGSDPDGALYKAVGIVSSLRQLGDVPWNGQRYTYPSQYEKKTREDEPFDDLTFVVLGRNL